MSDRRRGPRFGSPLASQYNPDPSMVRIAKERTRDILGAWSAQIQWGTANFVILAESCYMQGIHDAIDALQKQSLRIVPAEGDGTWEGYCG